MRTLLITSGLLLGAATAVLAQSKEDRQILDEAAAIDRTFEQRGLVYHDEALEWYLRDLAAPMLPPTSPDYVHWRFRILRDPLMNAMALPNGSVYVNTSLLAMLENDDQLAGILGHEITHVTNEHTFKFAKSYRHRMVVSDIMGAAFGWTPLAGPFAATAVVLGNLSEISMVVTLLGYGRELERESDKNAVELLQRTHRDPAQIARAFELFDERLDPEPVRTFWRDHPKTVERIAYISEMTGGKPARSPDPGYLARMRAVILHNARLDLTSRRFRTAVARIQRLVNADPRDSEALYWLGESYLSLGPRTVRPSEGERTDHGQNAAHKKAVKVTEEEETRALAATPEGKAALESNQARAAECFERAASLPESHFGMGRLFEQQNRKSEAAAEYRKFLEVAPVTAPDRLRAERRLESLEAK